MSNLKDALMKAGFKPSKYENERPKKRKKDMKASEKHQETRVHCDHCNAVTPDVERYFHNNYTVDAQWMCCRCADRNKIPDSTRKTAQSDMVKKNLFRREFGVTLSKQDIETAHLRKGKKTPRKK